MQCFDKILLLAIFWRVASHYPAIDLTKIYGMSTVVNHIFHMHSHSMAKFRIYEKHFMF